MKDAMSILPSTQIADPSPPDPDIPSTDALRQLNTRFGVRIRYPRFWSLISEGKVPAHRRGDRYYIKLSDLPGIASTVRDELGLTSASAAG